MLGYVAGGGGNRKKTDAKAPRPWGTPKPFTFHLSNEKNSGWLGYIGDEKLPRYIGIIIINLISYKNPY